MNHPPQAEIDEGPLAGTWRNADDQAAAPAIRTAALRRVDGRLSLHMIGVDDFDWGVAPVEQVFTAGPAATLAVGITASFERADRRARVHGNIKLGVMVLAAFMHVGSHAPTFTRDFLFGEGP
jgi:hypothetical protein